MHALDYTLSLEKAVLERAQQISHRPTPQADSVTKIPGYNDAHVWGMASQLASQGLIATAPPNGSDGVGVSEIQEAGAERLSELIAQEEAVLETRRIEHARMAESTRKKKWWQRAAR